MWSMVVVVLCVGGEEESGVGLVGADLVLALNDEHPVVAQHPAGLRAEFVAQGSDDSFAVRVRARCPRRGLQRRVPPQDRRGWHEAMTA
jgi:hypothetical protein